MCGGVDACVLELGDTCGADGCVKKVRKGEGLGRKVRRAGDGILAVRRVQILGVTTLSSLVHKERGEEKVRERQTSNQKEKKRMERKGWVCGTDDPTGCPAGKEAEDIFKTS